MGRAGSSSPKRDKPRFCSEKQVKVIHFFSICVEVCVSELLGDYKSMMRRIQSSETTVFIVDDNANHSAGIKQLLELQSDYHLLGIATNGESAIKQLSEAKVDIVLMDMSMPEVDGVAAIQQLMSVNPNLKILALTGYD